MPARPVGALLADELRCAQVGAIFGVMGDDTAQIIAHAIAAGIPYHPARHENAAVGMADGHGWARAGQAGVCLLTRGPGLLNGMNALRTAVVGRRRLVVISGDVPTTADAALDRKRVDVRDLARAIELDVMYATTPDAVVPAFREALAAASEGRPVLLSAPADVLTGNAADPSAAAPPLVEDGTRDPDDESLTRAADLITHSKRLLVLAGRGALAAGVKPSLQQLAERVGGLLGTTLLAKDLFRGHRRDIGLIGAFATSPTVDALREVDCVIAFGARLVPDTTTAGGLFRRVKVIQVDRDPLSIGRYVPATVGLLGDAGRTAQLLLERVSARERTPAPPVAAAPYGGPDESAPGLLDPRAVALALDAQLPSDRALVLDAGRFLRAAARYIRVSGPEAFRWTLDGGSVGLGIGVAVGAAIAAPPGRTTAFITGDGGLSMALGDLEAVARCGGPLVVAVFNDHGYGQERLVLDRAGLPREIAQLPPIDFAAVGRALGIEAVTVREPDELTALGPLLASRETPLLLDCVVAPDVTVPLAQLD